MKKLICFIAIAFLCVACAVFAAQRQPLQEVKADYLRIHVRANSNSAEDQQVKYEIKDQVVAFIAPYIAECVTKERALEVIGGVLGEIERVCDEELAVRGKGYRARAEIRSEQFPTRVYGDLTLEEGIYEALIIELGTGEGDNWWCVIYPPLCFTSASASVEYKSIVLEIINRFKENG